MESATGEKPGEGSAASGIPPEITDEMRPFWEGAAAGELLVDRCRNCGTYTFPPRGACPACRGFDIDHVPLEGTGTVHSFTVNYKAWAPGAGTPCTFALVEFRREEVRILGRLCGCEPDDVFIGMPVRTEIRQAAGGVGIPVFIPLSVEA